MDEYAIGFPSYVKPKVCDIVTGRFHGVAKVDIEPPKNLRAPALPESKASKLLFHLNPMKEKVFSSVG